MDGVDIHPWGPTEPDEMAVLSRLYGTRVNGPETVFTFRVGSLVPDTIAAALNEADKWIGTHGRPNAFTRDYASRHGNAFLTAPWCDMFVTYVARHASAMSIIPAGDRAFTPWHAGDFVTRHRYHPGTLANVKGYATTGAVLLYDWAGSDIPGDVDHIGLVIKNLGDGRCVTLEGNTSDAVALRLRGSSVIAVIGEPSYPGIVPAPVPPAKPPVKPPSNAWPYRPGLFMQLGWTKSAGVKRVQGRLNALGHRPLLLVDGDYGVKTRDAVKWFQSRSHLTVDGIVGPITWRKLFP